MKSIPKSIPLYYHPTEIIFIDDSLNFLRAMKLNFEDENFMCTVSNDPFKVIEMVNQNDRSSHQHIIKDKLSTDKENTEIDIYNIYRMIYLPERFRIISTVTLDYSMPLMNGLLVCEKFTNEDVSILLLTGEASHSVAIQAFNEKIINQFISKTQENLGDRLIEILNESKADYFDRMTGSIAKRIINSPNGITFLGNPHFVNLFYDIVKTLKAVEFYIISPRGDFLIIPEEGPLKILFVQNKEEMKDNQDIFGRQEIHLEDTHLFCYRFEYGEAIDSIKNAQSYFYPGAPIADTDLYYAITPADSFLGEKKFISFSDYRKSNPDA